MLAFFIHQHLSISFKRENMVNKVMKQNIECAIDNQIVKCYEKKTREYLTMKYINSVLDITTHFKNTLTVQ